MWNAVDKTIGKVDPGWSAKSCASRGGWVGWGVGSLLGGAQWAAYPWTGPVGMAVTGPIAGLIGTASVSSYIDNCDHQKPHG